MGGGRVIALERTIAYIPNIFLLSSIAKRVTLVIRKPLGDAVFLMNGKLMRLRLIRLLELRLFAVDSRSSDKAVYILARTSIRAPSSFRETCYQQTVCLAEVLRISRTWQTAGHKGYVWERRTRKRWLLPGSWRRKLTLVPGIWCQG